jgi:hypothetical protein
MFADARAKKNIDKQDQRRGRRAISGPDFARLLKQKGMSWPTIRTHYARVAAERN